MTQALDVSDLGGRASRLDGSRAAAVPRAQASAKFGTFAITFGISFAIIYTVFERFNWPLFTYVPAVGSLHFWVYQTKSGEGPPMFWYGWLTLSAASAFVVAALATFVSGELLRRVTIFCCVLAALWPASLAGLRFYIDWVSFNADFLNSVWLAAIPALVGAAAVSYFVSSRAIQRAWIASLLIMPVGGLVVLGYSLKPWFTH